MLEKVVESVFPLMGAQNKQISNLLHMASQSVQHVTPSSLRENQNVNIMKVDRKHI